jgi:SAM-dependent methyltransferase
MNDLHEACQLRERQSAGLKVAPWICHSRPKALNVVLCQLGLQFFPNQRLAVGEMRRVLKPLGRVGLSVYSRIEQTPGANAFVLALEDVLGTDTSRIKRGEHSFANPAQLEALLRDTDFSAVEVQTVEQTIVFPSVIDYVRFQLLATPMSVLLKDSTEPQRKAIISSIATKTMALSTSAMLDRGKFTFPQQAYVAIAQNS